MPHRSGRTVAAIVALLAAILFTSFQAPRDTKAHSPGIDRFLYALSRVESGWQVHGPATGRPAHTAGTRSCRELEPLGEEVDRHLAREADTAQQETVARGKIHGLYHWLGAGAGSPTGG